MKKYLLALILITSVVLLSCSDDDNDFEAPSNPVVAFVETDLSSIVEGDTLNAVVGLFSGRIAENDIQINWTTSGADTRSGTVTIAEGSVSTIISIPYDDNLEVDPERVVNLSIATTGDVPTTDEFGGTELTYEILDDLRFYSLGSNVEADTVAILENTGTIFVGINGPEVSDEDIEFSLEVDPSSTAVENVDYELIDGTSFNIRADSSDALGINVAILNDRDSDVARKLKFNLVGIDASDESTIVDTLANSIVYEIRDDTKLIDIDSIAGSPVTDGDTVVISGPGRVEAIFKSVENPLVIQPGVQLLFDASTTPPVGFSYPGLGVAIFQIGDESTNLIIDIDETAFPTDDGNEETDDDVYIEMTLNLASTDQADNEVDVTGTTFTVRLTAQ